MSSEGGVDFVFTRVRIRFKSEFEICSEITDLHPAFEIFPFSKSEVNQFPHLYPRSEENGAEESVCDASHKELVPPCRSRVE